MVYFANGNLNQDYSYSKPNIPHYRIIKMAMRDFYGQKWSFSEIRGNKDGLIGFNAIINRNGFLDDGSYYYGSVYSGENIHDENFESTFRRVESGKELFSHASDADLEAIEEIRKIFDLCKEKGIHVITYTPPYAPAVIDKMQSMDDKYAYFKQIPDLVSAVCLEYDYEFYDYTDNRGGVMWLLRIKDKMQRKIFLFGVSKSYYYSALGLVVAPVSSYLLKAMDDSLVMSSYIAVPSLLGLASAGTIVYKLINEGVEYNRYINNLYSRNRFPYGEKVTVGYLDGAYLKSAYVIGGYNGQLILFSEEVNSSNVFARKLKWAAELDFGVVDEVRALSPYALHKKKTGKGIAHNDKKIRLVDDLLLDDSVDRPITIQKTTYYDSLCTNEIVWDIIRSKDLLQPVYNGYEFMIDYEDKLYTLANSPCSNHIGITTIAVTRDRKLIFTQQTSWNMQNSGKLVPAGSGSADYEDYRLGDSLADLVIRASERELVEELSLCGKCSEGDIKTQVIGYARLLERGGKPEFFSISYVDVDSSVLTGEDYYIDSILLVDGYDEYKEGQFAGLRADLINKYEIDESRISVQVHLVLKFLEAFAAKKGELLDRLEEEVWK